MAGSAACIRVQSSLHVGQLESWAGACGRERQQRNITVGRYGGPSLPQRPARKQLLVTSARQVQGYKSSKALGLLSRSQPVAHKRRVPHHDFLAAKPISRGQNASLRLSSFLGGPLRQVADGDPLCATPVRGVKGGVPCCRLSDAAETERGLGSPRGLGFGCAPLRGPNNWRDVIVRDGRKAASGGGANGAKSEGPVPPLHAVATLQDNSTRMEYMDSEIVDNSDFEEFLTTPLPSHPGLIRGQLENGLRYVILPNPLPPNRFEAHLEMHVGSVDELDHEQGVAHLIEHVTFLGSKKRERILGTGARSNAYTDFHHTVFHVHSPVKSQETGEDLLPLVLDALHEIAFQPEFPDSRIEKERKAVLSELQMMNTIDYRVDCQLLQHLHSENKLGCRFPIGLEEQITKWDSATIQAFHKRWYFPGNATLFIVGDFGPVDNVLNLINQQFSKVPPAVYYPNRNPATSPAAASLHSPNPEGQNPKPSLFPGFSPSRSPSHTTSNSPNPETLKPSHAALQSLSSLFNSVQNPLNPGKHQPNPLSKKEVAPFPPLPEPIRKERHAIRPPVEHQWSSESMLQYAKSGYPAKRGQPVVPQVFQHELLQHFSMNIFSKNPVRPTRTYLDLRNVLMQRIVLSTFQFRINTRYKSANPPFSTIEMDHSDSGREGCSVTTLTIVSEAKDWRGAVQVAVQEVRRLKEFGVTHGELTRYLKALLKDSEQLAAMIDNIPSIDNLDFIMESDALGHVIMNQQQGHECLSAVADSVSLEDVNAVAVELLEFVSDFGNPSAPIPAAVVACVPQIVSGDAGSPDEPFFITPEEINETIINGLAEPIEGEPDLDVPKSLIPAEELDEKVWTRRPEFVTLQRAENEEGFGAMRSYDEVTGVVQRRLSNGIRVNYKMTQNEARGGVMRLVAAGGRARETQDASAAVAIGTRTLSEAGSVGKWSREQVELFCVGNLINCILETDEEFICLDFHFVMRDNGMEAAFQLMHMVLEEPVWRDDALDRAKQMYLSYYRSMPKSLERATAHTLMKSMFKGDARFMEPTPDAIAKLDLETVSKAVFDQLKTGDMEVSVVGDFTEDELERCLLKYLGTLSAKPETKPEEFAALEVPFQVVPTYDPTRRNQKVLLKDTDERACAFIAGAAPNRWGYTADGGDLNTINQPCPPGLSVQQIHAMANFGSRVMVDEEGSLYWQRMRHPLYASVALAILAEIINSRLFTTVRDALGLTYDVSFELSLFDRLKTGWFVISVTSTPGKIEDAVNASLGVLKGLNDDRISDRELARAKRTLLTRHESDLKDNSYWLSLMTHVQTPSVHRKDVGCIRDLIYLYESCTIEDVYNAYDFLALEDESLYTCKGIAGPPELLKKHAENVQATVIEVEGDSEGEDAQSDVLPMPTSSGRGRSTMTMPTT